MNEKSLKLQRYYHHVPIEIIQKDPTAQLEAERTLPIIIIKRIPYI
jgi:hypothetical protein